MSRTVNDQEFAAVSALEAPGRYEYFVHQVAASAQVWGLGATGGWVMAAADDGREYFPVWPHERYAAACASDGWAGAEPRSISLKDWRAKWLPGLERDGRGVAVFPLPAGGGVDVEPDRLRADLTEELAHYE